MRVKYYLILLISIIVSNNTLSQYSHIINSVNINYSGFVSIINSEGVKVID